MEATLLGLLAFCGVVIAALITVLFRGRNSRNNPGDQRVIDKLDGLQDHMGRLETKMDDAVHVLIEVRTILERRDR